MASIFHFYVKETRIIVAVDPQFSCCLELLPSGLYSVGSFELCPLLFSNNIIYHCISIVVSLSCDSCSGWKNVAKVSMSRNALLCL